MAPHLRAAIALSLLGVAACDFSEPKIYDGGGRAGGDGAVADTGVIPDAGFAGMVYIAGGTFTQGCTVDDAGCSRIDAPPHPVMVSSFWIDQNETSVSEFRKKCRPGLNSCSTGLPAPMNGLGCTWTWLRMPAMDDFPLNCVGWTTGQAYCESLGKRLPTESEWEYAARGGTAERTFPWGDALPDCTRAQYKCNIAAPEGPAVVGSFPAGDTPATLIHDLAGNLAELTASDFTLYPGMTGTPPPGKVVRGGGYRQEAVGLRTTSRGAVDPTDSSKKEVGFRCVKDP